MSARHKSTHDKSEQIAETNNLLIPISGSCAHMTYKQSQFIQDIRDIAFDGTDSALQLFKMIL